MPDPTEVREAVKEQAEAHARRHALHPGVVRSLDRYYETGDPACLDVTIFRDTRNAVAKNGGS